MTWVKKLQPNETIPLKLTATERTFLLEDLPAMETEFREAIESTPAKNAVPLTLDDLDALADYLAAEANHTKDKKTASTLNRVLNKITLLLDRHIEDDGEEEISMGEAAKRMAKALQDAESGKEPKVISFKLKRSQQQIKEKFPVKMTQHQRDSLIHCTRVKAAIKRKIETADEGTQVLEFTKKELDHLHDELGQAAYFVRSPHKQRLVAVLKKVDDMLQEEQLAAFGIKEPKRRRPSSESDLIFQFKITLLGTKPPIWRRIHVHDCSLDKLHEHIQTAMGWTNSHLHQFEIKGERYGDPQILDDGFDDFDCLDSTSTMLSELFPKNGKSFQFKYEYDFGDGWEHEIRFEGYPPIEKRKKYPICVEGERACPPEDVGGVWGYQDFLAAITDPEHEQHEMYMDWCGPFSPEEFDAKKATGEMKKGLPG